MATGMLPERPARNSGLLAALPETSGRTGSFDHPPIFVPAIPAIDLDQ
jgi:hypothetical protein